MARTFWTTVKILLKTPSVLIWCIAFPLFMAVMFTAMLSGISSDGSVDPVPVAVVRDESWDGSGFAQVVDALAAQGDDQLLDAADVDSLDAGVALIKQGDVAGVYAVDATGTPQVTLAPDGYASSSASSLSGTILESVADGYSQNRALFEGQLRNNPTALANPSAITDALSLSVGTERLSATRSTPDEAVRYYYALLAMVTLLVGSQTASSSVCALQPNVSVLGARRSVAGQSRARQLLGVICGCWAVSFASSLLTFCLVRFGAGVDFAGREGLCLVGLAVATLSSTALGALVAALPLRGGAETRSSMLIALTMGLSTFAGLYGQPSMTLADNLARACPAEAWLNPPRLVSDLFYSLYYYDALAPFALRVAACVGIAALMFGVSTVFLRRQRYEHL